MKVERVGVPAFVPIVITLNTPEEVSDFLHLCGCWYAQENCDKNENVASFADTLAYAIREQGGKLIV